MVVFPAVILAIDNESDRLFMQQLYQDYYKIMCAQAYQVLHDQQHVEDVLSDACLALIDKLDTLVILEPHVLRSYINSTVRNTSINYAKKLSRQRMKSVDSPDVAFDTMADDRAEVDSGLLLAEEVERMQRALGKLPNYERNVLEKKFFLNLTNDEIARELNIKPDSVRKFLLRARRRLNEIMVSQG